MSTAAPSEEASKSRFAADKSFSNPDSTTPASDPAQSSSSDPPSSSSSWFFSRWGLHAKARTIRALGTVTFKAHNAADPPAAGPDEWIYVDSTLGKTPKKAAIPIAVYRPSVYDKGKKKGAMINYHGGGFTIGSATDDSRWCRNVCKELGMMVFSVEYRMAPEHPFPVPVEDCADAILQLSLQSEELGFDPDDITLSGFSAGGNLGPAAWCLLSQPETWGYTIPPIPHPPTIRGLVLFYPLLDYSIPRETKVAALPPGSPSLPKFLTDLFDLSYIHPPMPRSDRTDLRLSPGLMSPDLLERCPPVHLVICEQDMLAEESRAFAKRLKGANKAVIVREVKGEAHGWDKPPPIRPKESVMVEYGQAVESMRGWIKGGNPAEPVQGE